MYIIWILLVWWNFNNFLWKKLVFVEKWIVFGVINCRNFFVYVEVYVLKLYFYLMLFFFWIFWCNSVFWLLFVFSLFCCCFFFVVICIVNWLMNGFFFWFCSKIVYCRVLLVIIVLYVKCIYVYVFLVFDFYFL